MAEIKSALDHIPSDERSTWIKIGMAIKSELGELGFEIWDEWSKKSLAYEIGVIHSQWDSFRDGGGVTVASIFHFARNNGWRRNQKPNGPPLEQSECDRIVEDTRRNKAEREVRQARAAARAVHICMNMNRNPVAVSRHGYVQSKSLSFDEQNLPIGMWKNRLVIPVKQITPDKITSCQFISPEGDKKFLKHGRVAGGMFIRRGNPNSRTVAICEGWATTETLHKSNLFARVICCFSANGMVKFSKAFRNQLNNSTYNLVAIADHDGAGRSAVAKTGYPYWMAPELGNDANDYMQQHGIDGLRHSLRSAFYWL